MKRQEPTTRERIALEKIAAGQRRWLLAGPAGAALIFSLRLLPERYADVSAYVAVGLVLGMVAIFVYRACMLRCPRCSGWIAIPKCPACGLKLDEPASHDDSRRANEGA